MLKTFLFALALGLALTVSVTAQNRQASVAQWHVNRGDDYSRRKISITPSGNMRPRSILVHATPQSTASAARPGWR